MTTKKETVRIHNKDYETVASRVARFREDHPDWAIVPEVFTDNNNENLVMVKTTIRNENDRTLAVGHAEEIRGTTQINKTSALENCETSSVGRALALLGYGGTELASADELTQALKQQADPGFHTAYMDKPAQELSGVASPKQVKYIETLRDGMKVGNPIAYEEFKAWYEHTFQAKPLKQLSKAEASQIIDRLNNQQDEQIAEIF